jgi:hypothetical protein
MPIAGAAEFNWLECCVNVFDQLHDLRDLWINPDPYGDFVR